MPIKLVAFTFLPPLVYTLVDLLIVLSIEDKLNYLEQTLPPVPVAPEGQQVAPEIIAAHTAWIKGSKEIDGLMLMTLEPDDLKISGITLMLMRCYRS
ncbi:hypothetical protein Tco_0382360 [Tanacetum coccineum]